MKIYFFVYLFSIFNLVQYYFFKKPISSFLKYFFLIFLIIFIGTRYNIGGDWDNYFNFFYSFESRKFELFTLDLLFYLLNYIVYNLGLSIYFLNTLTGLICIYCIVKYVNQLHNPNLALIISIPYIIFVVVMGYNRQGIALCILIYSLTFLKESKNLKFFILVLIASLFHFTAIIYIILLFLSLKRKILSILLGLILFFLFIFYYNSDFVEGKLYFYVSDGNYFASTGVYYRAFINSIPSLIYLIFYKNFKINNLEKKLYLFFAIISIVGLIFSSFATTLVDRFLIYFYPIQLFVFSNYNYYIVKRDYLLVSSVIFIIYFLVLYVYLVHGLYSSEWIPYKSILIKYD